MRCGDDDDDDKTILISGFGFWDRERNASAHVDGWEQKTKGRNRNGSFFSTRHLLLCPCQFIMGRHRSPRAAKKNSSSFLYTFTQKWSRHVTNNINNLLAILSSQAKLFSRFPRPWKCEIKFCFCEFCDIEKKTFFFSFFMLRCCQRRRRRRRGNENNWNLVQAKQLESREIRSVPSSQSLMAQLLHGARKICSSPFPKIGFEKQHFSPTNNWTCLSVCPNPWPWPIKQGHYQLTGQTSLWTSSSSLGSSAVLCSSSLWWKLIEAPRTWPLLLRPSTIVCAKV